MMDLFITVIRSMDDVYREYAESERTKAQNKNKNTSSAPSHIGQKT